MEYAYISYLKINISLFSLNIEFRILFQALDNHEVFSLLRPTTCKYARIGCPWRGPFHECSGHEADCSHPQKSGLEIMESLNKMDDLQQEQQNLHKDLFTLLSFEKVTFNGTLTT